VDNIKNMAANERVARYNGMKVSCSRLVTQNKSTYSVTDYDEISMPLRKYVDNRRCHIVYGTLYAIADNFLLWSITAYIISYLNIDLIRLHITVVHYCLRVNLALHIRVSCLYEFCPSNLFRICV